MNPDKEHEAYQRGFAAGQDHALPSRKTLEKFSELEKLMDEKLSGKVSWRSFNIILSILMSVVAGMFYLVWNKLGSVDESMSKAQQSMANIEGKLEPFDFIIEE